MIDKKLQFSLVILASLTLFLITLQFWRNEQSLEAPIISPAVPSAPSVEGSPVPEPPQMNQAESSSVDQAGEYMSELMENPIDIHGDMKVWVVNDNLESKVILKKGEQEYVLEHSTNDGVSNYSNQRYSHPKFSPQGNYLTFQVWGYEDVRLVTYSTNTLSIIDLLDEYPDFRYSHTVFFTPDERYLVACAASSIGGNWGGWVFALPELKNTFDLSAYLDGYANVACSSNDGMVIFQTESEQTSNNVIKKEFRFPLSTWKVEVLSR